MAVIRAGDVTVDIPCPRCGILILIAAHVAARLVVEESGAAIRATLRAKPAAHECVATPIDWSERPEPVTDPLFADEGPRRAPDWAERAAGG